MNDWFIRKGAIKQKCTASCGSACCLTGFFRFEKVGRFAATTIDVAFALALFGIESPRRDESQAGDARVLHRRQIANVSQTGFLDICW